MFDIGWMELLVIGIVALIVVGPRDLPEMFRQLGRFTAKLRQMGREFSRAMEQAADESGVADVKRDLNRATQPLSSGMNSLKSAADKFEKWDPVKNAAKPSQPLKPPPMPAQAPTPTVLPAAEVASEPAPAAAPVSAPAAAPGPNTQALYDKQAAKAAVVRETAAKLKALDAPAAAPAAPVRSPGRRRKPKAAEE